jgi:acetyl esterase/lipase
MFIRRHIWVVLLVVLMLTGCQSQSAPSVEEEPYIEKTDITFATVDGVELQLDLARPSQGEGPFPALVFVCGGGWGLPCRDTLSQPTQWAAESGYVAAAVDYRVVLEGRETKYPFPAQVHDVKCAVRWLRANAEQYAVDPERIGAIGFESGGSLALLLGLTDPSDGLEGDCGDTHQPSNVQAVVSLGGAADQALLYDATDRYMQDGLVRLLGGTPDESPEEYRLASPVTYVTADGPPVLSLVGELNERVPPEQGELLDKRMREVGASHTMTVLEGKTHYDLGNPDPELYETVFEFFDEHLR